jgi:hypothetical protein
MNKTLKRILSALFWYAMFDALVLGYAGFMPGVQLAAAQSTLTQTTLAADLPLGPASLAGGAQGAFATTVNLASATGIQQAFNGAPITWLYVDQELMGVLTTVPGQTTIFNVLRAQQGTRGAFHKANAVVYVQVGTPQFGGGAGSGGLYLADPPIQGNCTQANTLFTPWINVLTGQQFVCTQFQTPAGALITGWIPQSLPTFPSENAPSTATTTSAYTNATTTFSNVAGATANTGSLQFFAQANRTYSVTCAITWQGSANTTGPKYQFTGPASPTAVAIGVFSNITSSTYTSGSVTAFSSAFANSGTITATTNFTDRVTLGLVNGATAGVVNLQMAANGAGTLTVQPSSFCTVQ